jgi:antitoxin HicB
VSESEQYDHYSMFIQWDPEDHIYVVTVPELPGCMTHGRTYEEAIRQGKDAIESWIDANKYWGRPIPKPRVWTRIEEAV